MTGEGVIVAVLIWAIGFVGGAVWAWRIWDRAIREFEGDGEPDAHVGSPWYRIARRIR